MAAASAPIPDIRFIGVLLDQAPVRHLQISARQDVGKYRSTAPQLGGGWQPRRASTKNPRGGGRRAQFVESHFAK